MNIIRTDENLYVALSQTNLDLREALWEFYIQSEYRFFECWNNLNKDRPVEVWVDKLVETIDRYPALFDEIRTQFPVIEMEELLSPTWHRAQELAGVKEMPSVYFLIGAFEDNAFTTKLPAIGFCLEWFLSVEFLQTLNLPKRVRQFITLSEGLMPLFLTHEFVHTVQKLSLFETESLADIVLGEGMAVLFSEYACPGHSLEQCLFFSEAQLRWCEFHEQRLWRRFQADISEEKVEGQVFKSYLSPFGTALLPEAPPRVGYFIGYQICRKYLEATGESIQDLMALSSAEEIMAGSGYNP